MTRRLTGRSAPKEQCKGVVNTAKPGLWAVGCFARTWSTLKRMTSTQRGSKVGHSLDSRQNFSLDLIFHFFAPPRPLCKVLNSKGQLSLPKKTLKVIRI